MTVTTRNTAPNSASGLSRKSAELMALLAYVYLQNGRPKSAATLLGYALECDMDDATGSLHEMAADAPQASNLSRIPDRIDNRDRMRGALALALLRSDVPKKALKALDEASLAARISPPFQLLRAQILTAMERPTEAARAMRAFVQGRRRAGAGAHTS